MKYDRFGREFANTVYPGLKGDRVRDAERLCKEIEQIAHRSIMTFVLMTVAMIIVIVIAILSKDVMMANIAIVIGTVTLIICGMFAMCCYGRYTLLRPLQNWVTVELALGGKYEEEKHDGKSEE